jgi:L-seryl-tRNA(Ser) seleniumtransferase
VWEYEAAITDRTVAVAYFANPESAPPVEEVATLCHERGVPLIVDAAGQLPPAANLQRFIDAGADLVTFSGGKGLRGPQSSGILAGRRDLIMSVALQQLDLDEHWSVWSPPDNLIDLSKLRGFPRHGIGRGFKVAREEIVALLVALRRFLAGDYREDIARYYGNLRSVADGLVAVQGVKTHLIGGVDEDRFPMLELALDETALGISAFEVSRRLRTGTPTVYVNENGLQEGVLILHAAGLEERLIEPLTQRLREVLGG